MPHKLCILSGDLPWLMWVVYTQGSGDQSVLLGHHLNQLADLGNDADRSDVTFTPVLLSN